MHPELPAAEREPFASSLNRMDVVRAAQQQAAEEASPPPDWRTTIRRRLGVAAVLLFVWVVAIEARLVVLQVVEHQELVVRAERQRNRTITVPAKRGELLDRNGEVLAYSVDGDAIFAEPVLVSDPQATATAVCQALDKCTAALRERLAERLSRKRPFAYLERRVSPIEAERVRRLGIKGIGILREDRRFYPNRELAAHVLGYVGIDNEGLAGIEVSHEEQIKGRSGRVLLQTDAKNQAFARLQTPPTVGATLELTIDRYLQYIAERELEAGVAEFGAKGGTVIIMQPQTGDILALANWPTFNVNAYQGTPPTTLRNRAVQEVYEPGSTFKVVTASAALEEGVVRTTETFDVSAGQIRFGARVIEDVHRYGLLSFTDVIVKSSNVGAIKVGLRLGADRLSQYVRRFGFGQSVLGELPGETRGIVWDAAKLNDSALASVSMGYQVGVTPIQMATAVSAIANGGELVAPRLVRALVRDNRRNEEPPKKLRRVVGHATAATLTTIMESVVEVGTAKAARLDGYTVAGKTGTAAKLERGAYSKSNYNASFVGFVPSRSPAVTILVVIDSPHGKGYYGGAVAAPIFKRVAERTVRYLGIGPTVGEGALVLVAEREPSPRIAPRPARTASLLDVRPGRLAADGLMPDLRGMCAREAVQALARIGLVARLQGDGVVVAQSVPPGEQVQRGGPCTLLLERRVAADGAMP